MSYRDVNKSIAEIVLKLQSTYIQDIRKTILKSTSEGIKTMIKFTYDNIENLNIQVTTIYVSFR